MGHWLDHVVSFTSGRRRVFQGGWGDRAVLDRFASAARFEAPPSAVQIAWGPRRREGDIHVTDGAFDAPVAELPPAARRAVVRRLSPTMHAREGKPRPVYVVLASSGEEGFAWRERVWRPLVATAAIEAILLENALYGARRPEGQRGTDIHTVSDHLLMNASMVEEARALHDWLAREGHEHLGIAGFSMGGSMAALVAAVTPRPLAAAIFAAGRSGVPVFTEGFLARRIDFDALGGAGAKERLGEVFAPADLDRHAAPRRPDAAVLVGARRDGYVFASEIEALHARWPRSDLRWVDTGHAGALFFEGEALRQAARDAMTRLARPL